MVPHDDCPATVNEPKDYILRSEVLPQSFCSLNPTFYRTIRSWLCYTCANFCNVVYTSARPPLPAF